jgi:hypothetical protein
VRLLVGPLLPSHRGAGFDVFSKDAPGIRSTIQTGGSDCVVFKSYALCIVLAEPFLRRFFVGEDFEVVDVTNLFAGVDINADRFYPKSSAA